MKKIITLILIVIVIIGAVLLAKLNKTTEMKSEEKWCTIQIIADDAMDNSQKVVYEQKVKENDIINMQEYSYRNHWDDIKILEINDNNVKISREVIKYKILDTENQKYKKYSEKLEEYIEYNKEISANISEDKPWGPAYDMERFWYTVKFIK